MDLKKVLFKTKEIDVEKSLPDSVVYCNKEGKILWINDKVADIFETSKMHIMTSKISDFIENALNLIQTAIKSDRAIIVKMNSCETYFDMTVKEVDDGYVLAFRDISNNNSNVHSETEDIVNYDKNNFLISLSNDFKSPLQSIIGFSQAMSDGLGGTVTEQQDKYIRIINKNASELMYFVDKLLDLSQTEVYDGNIEFKTFDILSTINSIVKYNEHLYKDKAINFSVQTEENISSRIISNEDIFKKVFQSILEVILKAVEMGNIQIKLSFAPEELLQSKNIVGNYIILNIFCSSLLFSENDLDCLFEPYKIINTPNRKNLIRSITLATVRNRIKELKGFMWVDSQVLKNTSFNILLPIENV